ncbi:MAG: MBL fold metallo-hydrolase [Mobilicoccus sp.]|nr:MBL fold metallo-hydrolase [Mobilicoccus sp.]
MFLLGFPATAFATNCFVIAPSQGEECLIVDPGLGVVDRLADVLRTHKLKPAAVLLTHGHLDHTYSVTPVCGSHDVAAYIHGDDEYRLANPADQLGPELRMMLESQFGGLEWTEPSDVVTIEDRQRLTLANMEIEVAHAPGHTEGSVLFSVETVPDALPDDSGLTRTIFAGDVLFAGGIGRTDLIGGDDAAMQRSLRDVILGQPDDSLVFPGHGPATTIARERATNPYLANLA